MQELNLELDLAMQTIKGLIVRKSLVKLLLTTTLAWLVLSSSQTAFAKPPVTEKTCRDAYYHSMFEKKRDLTIRKLHVANDICACLIPEISGQKRLEDAWRNIEYALGGRLDLLDMNVRQSDMDKVKDISTKCSDELSKR